MERRLAPKTVEAQINEIAPSMWSDDLTTTERNGDVWLAWKKPVRIALGQGFAMLDELIDPIARIDMDYPLSAAMRHRVKSYETNIYAGIVKARAERAAAERAHLADIDHEIRADFRRAAVGRVQVPQWR